jgi:hypothetical protein
LNHFVRVCIQIEFLKSANYDPKKLFPSKKQYGIKKRRITEKTQAKRVFSKKVSENGVFDFY